MLGHALAGIVGRKVAGDHERPVARLQGEQLPGGSLQAVLPSGGRCHGAELRPGDTLLDVGADRSNSSKGGLAMGEAFNYLAGVAAYQAVVADQVQSDSTSQMARDRLEELRARAPNTVPYTILR